MCHSVLRIGSGMILTAACLLRCMQTPHHLICWPCRPSRWRVCRLPTLQQQAKGSLHGMLAAQHWSTLLFLTDVLARNHSNSPEWHCHTMFAAAGFHMQNCMTICSSSSSSLPSESKHCAHLSAITHSISKSCNTSFLFCLQGDSSTATNRDEQGVCWSGRRLAEALGSVSDGGGRFAVC